MLIISLTNNDIMFSRLFTSGFLYQSALFICPKQQHDI